MGILDQVKTRAEVVDEVEALLQDTGNAIWTAAEIGTVLDRCLIEIARYRPYMVKETLTTTADSRDLDISSITDLVGIEKLEYKVDKYPQQWHNWDLFGDTLTMRVATAPVADESVYLYCRKAHHLDADWAAATAYTKGQFVSPTTKNGYRYECTTAGTSHADTEPTWGTTAAGTTEDNTAVWTCRAEKSNSLDVTLEGLLVQLAAIRVVQSKAVEYVNSVNQGGLRAPVDYQTWAAREWAELEPRLRALGTPRGFVEHPQ